jgi:indolepyruvate ferredoxin oxidoreductase
MGNLPMAQHLRTPSTPPPLAEANTPPRTPSSPARPLDDFTLDDKFTRENGAILLSGVQAIMRAVLDQRRADLRAGLNTATLISGYRGSPLGGLDMLLNGHPDLLKAHHVHFQPGLNEDLAATAIFGSQIANLLPAARYDGVLGVWYGKAPGVDRTGDAFRHANFAGVAQYGGVLALAGDDPAAKSSTLPSASEYTLYDVLMPTLYPGNVQEVLDYGLLGFALSRYTGLWVGVKFVTNVADEYSTAQVAPDRLVIRDPGFEFERRPWAAIQNPMLLTPYSLTTERRMIEGRWEAARHFSVANDLNKIVLRGPDDWLGIIAPGKTYYDLRQALHELGLDDATLRRLGVRLLKIGLLAPLDPGLLRDFAGGLREILVIEEKRPFIERFVREALYNLAERPRVVGKTDENDAPLLPAYGEFDADLIARLLVKRLRGHIPADSPLLERVEARLHMLDHPPMSMSIPLLARTPYYCSGCPHNTSTTSVPDGSLVGAGIGCHTMILLMDHHKANVTGVTQMGGEGAQWVGAMPFTDTPHIFQNIGDGTLFHSGSLAIRQAVAAGAHLTYKILWNSAVAMTGGQDLEVQMPVWRLTHLLRAEGVGRIIVTTPDTGAYPPDADWAAGVQVWPRERIEEAQIALRDTPGVTALIHDQECAAELRRKRRRGLAPEPETRVFINEAVCEGCGDCGEKSNCLSVFPVETEFGRKTQIHQSSCNKDYSCLKGHCPAFLTVIPNTAETKRDRPFYDEQFALPAPEFVGHTLGEANLYMMGIGGTGVVTVNQIIATAAMIDGKHVTSLDQTGLSQKGGPVVSHLRILDAPVEAASKISAGLADGYLVFDLLTGTDFKNLRQANPAHTVAVVSTSEIPTGQMVSMTDKRWPASMQMHQVIDDHTVAAQNVYFDAIGLSEALFGSHMPANMMVVGAAYQRGLIPLSVEALERAIELNGVSVKANLQAFRVGRRLVAEPGWAPPLTTKRAGDLDATAPELSAEARALIDSSGATGELRRLLEIRAPELIAYQNAGYAGRYVEFVRTVMAREKAIMPGETRLSEAVARYLYKLMAYKDEYEVARLHLKAGFKDELAAQFGESARYAYMLFPPMLRHFGLRNKIKLGRWFDAGYALLTRMKGLRGTPLDFFGYDKVRRTERALIAEYRVLIEETLAALTPASYERAVELAALPDLIRGYDHIKLANVEKFRAAVAKLRANQ